MERERSVNTGCSQINTKTFRFFFSFSKIKQKIHQQNKSVFFFFHTLFLWTSVPLYVFFFMKLDSLQMRMIWYACMGCTAKQRHTTCKLQLQRILSVTEPKFDRKLQQYAQNCSRQRHTLLGFGLELNAGKNLLLNLIESFLIKLCTQFG